MRIRRALLGMGAAALIAGCAGDGEGLDQNGRPIEEDQGTQLTPDFDSIQSNVLTPACTACHSGAAAPLGLRLDAGASYALLVNAPSTEVPAVLRVDPGNPDASYLIQKLEGTAAVGARMPLGGPPLPQDTIAVIRQWVLEGAPASASAAGNAPSLSAAWPLQGGSLQSKAEVVIAADRELDTSLLSAGTLVLTRSGGDADFANGNEVTVDARIELRSLSPTVLAVRSTQEAWAADTYRMRISGGAPLAVTDLSSVPLDGDSYGAAGGDFELTFSVEQDK
jgi:hypothetical protein